MEPYADLSAFDLFETLKLLGYGMEEVGEGFEIVRLDHMGASTADILPGYMEANFARKWSISLIVEG